MADTPTGIKQRLHYFLVTIGIALNIYHAADIYKIK